MPLAIIIATRVQVKPKGEKAKLKDMREETSYSMNIELRDWWLKEQMKCIDGFWFRGYLVDDS